MKCLLALFLLSSVCLGSDPSRFDVLCDLALKQAIAETEAKALQIPKSGPGVVERKRQSRETLAKLNSGKVVVLPEVHPETMRVGDVGRLAGDGHRQRAVVFQVLNETDFALNITTDEDADGKPTRATVVCRGFPMENIVDGRTIILTECVRVSGRATLPTVSGSARTVFVVERFDPSGLIPKGKEIWLRPGIVLRGEEN